MTRDNSNTVHVFERAGLGRAPFRFIGTGVEIYQAIPGDPNCPIQPGTSCDYCGQGIRNVCYIKDVDGKRFKVGCDCVLKTGDRGIVDPVKRAVNRAKREAKAKRDRARISRCRETITRSDVRTAMAATAHPDADGCCGAPDQDGTWAPFSDLAAHSLLSWAEWMLEYAGTAGCIKVCRVVEKVAKELS
jgi:hypothetical protein